MSEMTPNVELVRQGLAAFLGGDMDGVLELAHPDIVSIRTAPLPDPQTYHGFEGSCTRSRRARSSAWTPS
jgi:ketosteroid isomerase-like protein